MTLRQRESKYFSQHPTGRSGLKYTFKFCLCQTQTMHTSSEPLGPGHLLDLLSYFSAWVSLLALPWEACVVCPRLSQLYTFGPFPSPLDLKESFIIRCRSGSWEQLLQSPDGSVGYWLPMGHTLIQEKKEIGYLWEIVSPIDDAMACICSLVGEVPSAQQLYLLKDLLCTSSWLVMKW